MPESAGIDPAGARVNFCPPIPMPVVVLIPELIESPSFSFQFQIPFPVQVQFLSPSLNLHPFLLSLLSPSIFLPIP
ncbi:MAG: hypothetical protein HA492_01310 [Candidatus Verstraetearchaeota archaeon]|nr:hypothetical protein [Candidatus Verstraetearchaeota archaeon]